MHVVHSDQAGRGRLRPPRGPRTHPGPARRSAFWRARAHSVLLRQNTAPPPEGAGWGLVPYRFPARLQAVLFSPPARDLVLVLFPYFWDERFDLPVGEPSLHESRGCQVVTIVSF